MTTVGRKTGLWVLAVLGACAPGTPSESSVRQAATGGVSTWTERTPDTGPVKRTGAAMAFDPVRKKAVLYGGAEPSLVAETWEWDSDTRAWAPITPLPRPPRLRDHRMAYFDGAIILYGGENTTGGANADIYKYDPSGPSWNRLSLSGQPPPGRWGHGMAVVPGVGLVIHGGIGAVGDPALDDTWILPSLTDSWSDASGTADQRAPARSGHAFFYDATAGQLVLFGGQVTSGDGGDAGVSASPGDDTWTGALGNGLVVWSPASTGKPTARTDSPAVWFPPFATAVLFSNGTAADTWLYAGGWAADAPSGNIPARTGQAMTFDASRGVVLLFGGTNASGLFADTWEYAIDAKPVLTAPATASGTETHAVMFDVSASDTDASETISLTLASMTPVPMSQPDLATLFPPASGAGAASGSFAWTPGCRDHGAYTLSFHADDGVNDPVTATTHLTIADADCPPVWNAINPPTFATGSAGSFTVSATDPDGDTVTYSLDALVPAPHVAPTLNGTTGLFSWTPGTGDGGSYSATFHAHAAGADVPTTIMLSVTTTNLPPVLNLPPPQAFVEGTTGGFVVSATDPDGDPVTLAFTGITPTPVVAPTFTPATGAFSWTPGFLDAGTYSAGFSATDGSHPAVTGTVTIVVANSNRAPVLTVSPTGTKKKVTEGSTLVFTVSASDLDTDDTLTLSHGALPLNASASVNGASVTITFTPGSDQGSPGGTPYLFDFTASDGHDQSMLTVTVSVLDQDRPPVIMPIPPQTVAEGQTLTFTVSATDPDGQALVYSALALPAGATFDPTTHVFRWTAPCDAADAGGMTSARFNVSDGVLSSTLDVAITVTGTVLLLSPPSLSFPTTRVGTAATPLTVTVTNGSASTSFTVVSVAVGDSTFSATAQASLPAPLGPGGTMPISVGFHPDAAQSYASVLTVTIDDPVCGVATVPVGGVGQNAGVQVSRSGADFGQVRVGTTSAPADFTVTNSGDQAFTVQSITLSETTDFTLTLTQPGAGGYPIVLGPGATVTFEVAARPTQLGLLSGQISVNTDVAGATATLLPIEVVGVAPGLSVSESRIDFGDVDLRGAAAMHALVVTNFGTTTLTVGQPALTGPGATAYDVAGIGDAGLLLDAGRSATVVVLFQPVVEGDAPAAALQLTSDAPDQPSIVVLLAGHGIDRHLRVAPTSLDFGSARVGVPVTKSLVVTNGGEAPLVFGTPAATVAAPFAVTGIPAMLAAGSSATLTVTFTPTTSGAASGDLVLASDDAVHPALHVPLTGDGLSADLSADPASLDAGTVVVGGERTMPLAIENGADSASHTLTMSCVAMAGATTCGGAADFRVDGAGGSIGPHGKATLSVTFAPQASGAASATLLVFSDGAADPTLSVPLSGDGTDDVRLSGGGCSVGGSGGTGEGLALVVIVLVGLALRRRRVLALLLVAGTAAADGSFDLDVFRPTTVPGSAFVTVERPEVLGEGALGFAATFDYARNPLYAVSGAAPSGVATRETPVANRGAMTLTAAYGVGGGFELAASLPVIVESGSADMTGVASASGAGVGDAVLEGRLRLVPGLLAVSALVGLPTGDGDRYEGTGGLAGELRFVAGTALGRFRLAANAGLRLRAEARLGSVAQGNAVTFGAGASVGLADRIDALGEIYGAAGFDGDVGAASPVEGILGVRVRAAGIVFTAGGGAGLQSGIGAADLRIFAGLAFAVGGRRQAPAIVAAPDAPSTPPVVVTRAPDAAVPVAPAPPVAAEDEGETAILLTPDRIELLVPIGFRGAELTPAARPVLTQVASALRAHPEIARLVVAVHVEPTRYPDRDRQVAEQRAAAIRAALVQRGVAAGRIELDPVGSARPLKKGLSERVELLIK